MLKFLIFLVFFSTITASVYKTSSEESDKDTFSNFDKIFTKLVEDNLEEHVENSNLFECVKIELGVLHEVDPTFTIPSDKITSENELVLHELLSKARNLCEGKLTFTNETVWNLYLEDAKRHELQVMEEL